MDREKRIVQTAIPWTVVRHDERSIALYLSPGTTLKQRTGRYGGPRDRMLLEWDGGYKDRVWNDTNTLMPTVRTRILLGSRAMTRLEPRWWY